MGWHIYLPHTPLNVLYTLALIHAQVSAEVSNHRAILFLFHDFATAPQVSARLAALLGDRYIIQLLPGQFTNNPRFSHPFIAQPPLRKFAKHVPLIAAKWQAQRWLRRQNEPIQRVYVFNDMRPDVQAILTTTQAGGCQQFTYVEDGIGAYFDRAHTSNLIANQMRWLFPLVYGRGFARLDSLGAYPILTDACLTFPAFANQALRHKPVASIPPLHLELEVLPSLLSMFGRPPSRPTQATALVCVPHSQHTTATGVQFFRSLIQQLTEQAFHILVKGHPRDPQDVLTTYVPTPQLTIELVDRSLPAELICAWLGPHLQALYAEPSTILHTAKWLNNAVQVYCVTNDASIPLPPEVVYFLNSIGVQFTVVGQR